MPKVEDYRIAAPFSLEELVAAANSLLRSRTDFLVGRRTVRYYIQEGIIAPPTGAPKYARYSYEHLLRLVLVRLLLAQGLRLEAIRTSVEDFARGGPSRLEAAVTRMLQTEPEGEELLVYAGDAGLVPGLRFAYGVAAKDSAPPPTAEDPEEPPPDWEALPIFRRIRLTERVSLEVAPGGDLARDLEAAAEALDRFLQNLRDTT